MRSEVTFGDEKLWVIFDGGGSKAMTDLLLPSPRSGSMSIASGSLKELELGLAPEVAGSASMSCTVIGGSQSIRRCLLPVSAFASTLGS